MTIIVARSAGLRYNQISRTSPSGRVNVAVRANLAALAAHVGVLHPSWVVPKCSCRNLCALSGEAVFQKASGLEVSLGPADKADAIRPASASPYGGPKADRQLSARSGHSPRDQFRRPPGSSISEGRQPAHQLGPRTHRATSRSHAFAEQLAGLLHPSGELGFVELGRPHGCRGCVSCGFGFAGTERGDVPRKKATFTRWSSNGLRRNHLPSTPYSGEFHLSVFRMLGTLRTISGGPAQR
jgi:hypothetical protein